MSLDKRYFGALALLVLLLGTGFSADLVVNPTYNGQNTDAYLYDFPGCVISSAGYFDAQVLIKHTNETEGVTYYFYANNYSYSLPFGGIIPYTDNATTESNFGISCSDPGVMCLSSIDELAGRQLGENPGDVFDVGYNAWVDCDDGRKIQTYTWLGVLAYSGPFDVYPGQNISLTPQIPFFGLTEFYENDGRVMAYIPFLTGDYPTPEFYKTPWGTRARFHNSDNGTLYAGCWSYADLPQEQPGCITATVPTGYVFVYDRASLPDLTDLTFTALAIPDNEVCPYETIDNLTFGYCFSYGINQRGYAGGDAGGSLPFTTAELETTDCDLNHFVPINGECVEYIPLEQTGIVRVGQGFSGFFSALTPGANDFIGGVVFPVAFVGLGVLVFIVIGLSIAGVIKRK